MKHYRSSGIALIAASVLLLLLTLKEVGRTRRVAADLLATRREVETASRDLRVAQAAAAKAKLNSAPVDDFLAGWNREMDAAANLEAVFGKLDTLAVGDVLSSSGRNLAARPNYIFRGHKMPVQDINITVAGDFYRTLNWLGSVEAAFPLARVEQVSYAASGNSLTLAVQLVFPRNFDAE